MGVEEIFFVNFYPSRTYTLVVYFVSFFKELFVEEFSRTACNQAAKAGRIYINYDDLGVQLSCEKKTLNMRALSLI